MPNEIFIAPLFGVATASMANAQDSAPADRPGGPTAVGGRGADPNLRRYLPTQKRWDSNIEAEKLREAMLGGYHRHGDRLKESAIAEQPRVGRAPVRVRHFSFRYGRSADQRRSHYHRSRDALARAQIHAMQLHQAFTRAINWGPAQQRDPRFCLCIPAP